MHTIIDQVKSEINTRYSEQIEDFPLDGKIHRCGDKDHLWIVGNSWDFKGKSYAQVKFGSWRDSSNYEVKSWAAADETKSFKKSFAQHTQDTQAKLKLTKMEKHKECKEKWGPIFKKAKTDDHGYLNHKEIGPHNSKVWNENLLIPAFNINGFVGVQRIFENPKTGRFEKRFSSGIEIKGAICPLSSFKDSDICYVTEGFATGGTIQELFPEIPVVVCFMAGNIIPAIATIRAINPSIKIIVAADNDMESKTGEKAAKQAVYQFKNVIYRIPKFKAQNSSWSDYNDLANFESRESVTEQLTIGHDEFTNILPLGYLGGNYYYTSTSNQQIVPITATNHSQNSFLHLANIAFWYKSYGIKDADGNYTGIDWKRAASDLMESCRNEGLFNPDDIRGRGVWIESGTPIINNGPEVYPEIKNPAHHYQKSAKINYGYESVASDEEMLQLLQFFKNLRYKNENDYIYLAAWYIQAQIFSCLDWRFHLWLTGDRGAGKSTILKWVESLLIHPILSNNATAAGIRQKLEGDAFPFIFDEAEPNTERTEAVIELARQMSSNGDFQTLRGTSNGAALKYNTQTIFLFGSIQLPQFNAADASRIFVVEMASTKGQTIEEYDDILERVEYFGSIKNKIFGRCFENIPQIRKNIQIAQKWLRTQKMESRLADQLAVTIACFYIYLAEDELNEEALKNLCEKFGLLESDYTQANKTKDSEDCLSQLMQIQVDRDGRTVSWCLEVLKESKEPAKLDDIHRYLGVHGLRFYPETGELFVAKSDELTRKMKHYPAYFDILKRDSTITIKSDVQAIKAISTKTVRGIRVRL
jgi:phage/plasmid primase-like uncharacterized protein